MELSAQTVTDGSKWDTGTDAMPEEVVLRPPSVADKRWIPCWFGNSGRWKTVWLNLKNRYWVECELQLLFFKCDGFVDGMVMEPLRTPAAAVRYFGKDNMWRLSDRTSDEWNP